MLLKHLKSEKGMAMALTLVISAVVVVISSVFWYASSSRTIHATKDANQIKAYYFARSGVEAALGLLYTEGYFPHYFPSGGLKFYGNLNDLNQGEPVNDDYSLKFIISEVDKGLKIKSEGCVGGAQGAQSTSEELTLLLPGWTAEEGQPDGSSDQRDGDAYTFDYAVFTQADIALGGSARIEGPVGTNSGYVEIGNSGNCKITNAGEYPGTLSLGPGADVNKPDHTQGVNHFSPEKDLPAVPNIPDLPAFPYYPNYPDYHEYPNFSDSVPKQLNVNNNTTESLDPTKANVYNKISFGWNKTLTFDLNGDTTVVIQDINGSGNINLSGQGNLFLVVDKNLDGLMNINAGGDQNRLTVLYTGISGINRRSDSEFFGDLYAPNATFNTSNKFTMAGDLVIGGNSVSIGSSNEIDGSIYAPNATFRTNSKFTMVGDLVVGGNSISIGSASEINGSIYAPIANINTTNPVDISGDIVTGGASINFNGVSHNGNIYVYNNDASIKYSGNRPFVDSTITNIYSKGKKVEIDTAHLQGDIYLSNQNAEFKLSGSSTLIGNIYTKGAKIEAPGNVKFQGFVYAPNNNAIITLKGSSSMLSQGAIITAGSNVSFIGHATAFQGVVYAPNADVSISGSSNIHGAVVSKTFDGGNGNRAAVSYVPISSENFHIPIEGGYTGEPAEDSAQGYSGGIWLKNNEE